MACLKQHRPKFATVLDLEREEQLPEVLSWAEEAAQYVEEAVLLIPKVSGIISRLPRWIGGKEVRLAYSVPTRFAGSPVPLWEHSGWPIHLLGGSPQAQHEIWRHLGGIADVVSLDGNMHKKQATSRCLYWTRQITRYGHWQPLGGFDGNGPEEAFRRSSINILKAWEEWA